jgi:hypothetical protein
MEQPTPIEWLQQVYKVTGQLKESDFDYANNLTKENTYTEEQISKAIALSLEGQSFAEIIKSLKHKKD